MSATDGAQNVDLPVRTADGLSEERKSSIRNAVQRYRERVLQQNMSELERVIEDIESKPPRGPPYPPYQGQPLNCSEDEAPQKRIEYLQSTYGIQLDPEDPTVRTVSDFLSEDRRENLIRTNRLDGVSPGEVNATRNAWIQDVEERMATAERARVRPNALPADLKYLMTLVRGLSRPGLPQERESRHCLWLSDLDEDEDENNYVESGGAPAGWIAVPATQEEADNGELGDLPEEWCSYIVAMAVGIGGYNFAAYCREETDESDDGWRWRFGWNEIESQSNLYDTIEEFLDYNAEVSEEENLT